MPTAIIIHRIARRTGIVGRPRATSQEGIRRLEPGEKGLNIARKVLTEVKKRTAKDGHDRQIEYVTVQLLKKTGRRKITSRILWRVYRSQSDHKVYVYPGPSHQGPREKKED